MPSPSPSPSLHRCLLSCGIRHGTRVDAVCGGDGDHDDAALGFPSGDSHGRLVIAFHFRHCGVELPSFQLFRNASGAWGGPAGSWGRVRDVLEAMKTTGNEEVEYKEKSGTAWSHSYLNQKPWHPLSYPNQRRKWIAEQQNAQKSRKSEEVAHEVSDPQCKTPFQ